MKKIIFICLIIFLLTENVFAKNWSGELTTNNDEEIKLNSIVIKPNKNQYKIDIWLVNDVRDKIPIEYEEKNLIGKEENNNLKIFDKEGKHIITITNDLRIIPEKNFKFSNCISSKKLQKIN